MKSKTGFWIVTKTNNNRYYKVCSVCHRKFYFKEGAVHQTNCPGCASLMKRPNSPQ